MPGHAARIPERLATRAQWNEVNYRHQGYKLFLTYRKNKVKNIFIIFTFALDILKSIIYINNSILRIDSKK